MPPEGFAKRKRDLSRRKSGLTIVAQDTVESQDTAAACTPCAAVSRQQVLAVSRGGELRRRRLPAAPCP